MAILKTSNLSKFEVNGTTISQVASATVNITQASIDVTEIDSTFKEMEYGFAEGTVDVEVFFDSAVHGWLTSINTGAKLTAVKLIWTTGKSIAGDALVESASISVAPNGVVQGNFTFRFANSALTIA